MIICHETLRLVTLAIFFLIVQMQTAFTWYTTCFFVERGQLKTVPCTSSHAALPSGTMYATARIYCIFLLSTLVSCTVFIDDQDHNSAVLWGGRWDTYIGYDRDLAWKGSLSLANRSGTTVTFTFTGESEALAQWTSLFYAPLGPVLTSFF